MTNFVKTVFLLGVMTALIMLIGGIFGGRHGVEIAFVFAAAMNFFSYWFSDKMVLRAYGAKALDRHRRARTVRHRPRASGSKLAPRCRGFT